MRRTMFCLIFLFSIAACENSTDPFIGFGGSPGLTAAQADGSWSFTVTRTSALGCTGGSMTNGQVVTANLDVLTDGTLSASTSSWQAPGSTLVRPLSGSVNLSTGFADVFMSASSGSTAAMELRGTMTTSGSFSGTLTDPAPGSFQVFGACSYTATGNKTS